MTNVTRMLKAVEQGRHEASDELLPIVYDELRLLAAHQLSHEVPGQTLQATALVHEAYIRLVGTEDPRWEGRRHFFAAAAEAMRRILVENARRKQGPQRGGQGKRVDLALDELASPNRSRELLNLDEALNRLEAEDADAAELVKLRYFAGMTSAQAATTLGIPLRTAERLWAYARGWLRDALSQGGQ